MNIPAGTLHGIDTGEAGCEFMWMFPGQTWTDIPYLYADRRLRDRNVDTRERRTQLGRVNDEF